MIGLMPRLDSSRSRQGPAALRGLAAILLMAGVALLAWPGQDRALAQRRGRVRLVPPSVECPEPGRSLPEGASRALEAYLGPDARALCLGDLNGNGRRELLAARVERSFGSGMGFYWVTRNAGLFEEGTDRAAIWRPLLRITDRLENTTTPIGWKRPVEGAGIGLRYTMTDGGRLCLQLRRLDANFHRLERPLLLVRWDPAIERYATGACADGTRGDLIKDR